MLTIRKRESNKGLNVYGVSIEWQQALPEKLLFENLHNNRVCRNIRTIADVPVHRNCHLLPLDLEHVLRS